MTNIVQLDFNDLQTAIKSCLQESIEELKNLSTKEEKTDRCTLLDAIEITGLKSSALYKLTMSGVIPHEKFGKRLVFSRKELDEWMKKRTIRKQSPEEIAIQHLAKVAKRKMNKSFI